MVSVTHAGTPNIWYTELLTAFKTPLVYEGLTNRKYEGEIKNVGDTVRILTTVDPTLVTYTQGSAMTPTLLGMTDQTLVITDQNGFNIGIEDIDLTQNAAKGFPAEQMARGAYKFKIARDAAISSAMATAANTIGSTLTAQGSVGVNGSADPYEIIVDLGTKLRENDVPMDSGMLFVVVPFWFAGELVKDPRKSSFGTTDNLKSYGSRYIGRDVSGLEIFQSNVCPAGINNATYDTVIAGWDQATAFAAQITKYREEPIQGRFATAHLGLDTFGVKVVQPLGLATIEVKKA